LQGACHFYAKNVKVDLAALTRRRMPDALLIFRPMGFNTAPPSGCPSIQAMRD